jgi:hypothetical protein
MRLVTGIDHVYATAPDASRVFRAFHEVLGLPAAWPFQSWGAFSSGGVSFGNVVLELTQWTSRWKRALPLEFAGIALEPEGPTATVVAALDRHRIPHAPPVVSTTRNAAGDTVGWTNTGLSDFHAANVFLCDYANRSTVSRVRADAARALEAARGGPLGVRQVSVIEIASADATREVAAWQAIAEAPAPARDGEVVFSRGPRVRVLAARTSGIRGIVVEVRSLSAARAELHRLDALTVTADGRVRIGPSLVGTLQVELVAAT